jgi:hypothetical protein
MIFSGAVPAFAQATSTSVTGGTMSFNKYLIIPSNAVVPNTRFDFSISAGEAIPATGTTQQVKAGIEANQVSISDPSFNKNDATSKNAPSDVTMPSGTKIATKAVSVDFSKVTFTTTGIYRYKVSETVENSAFAMTESSKALDVYVTRDDNGLLKVQAYVLHSIAKDATVKKNTADAKESGFVNTYNAHDLAFEKVTRGNQRNPNDEFSFTLNISRGLKNTTYAVGTTSTNAENPTSVTTDENGKASNITVYLKAGERFAVYGLNDGASYSVSEKSDSLGYDLKEITFAEGNFDKKLKDGTAITLKIELLLMTL